MATLQVPSGQFVWVELEPGLNPSRVRVLFHAFVAYPGVVSAQDASLIPIEFLTERILMRLDPEDWPLDYRGNPQYEAIRKHHQRKRQPPLSES